EAPPHKRQINTVFQNYALFPHMTVAQNIGFGLEMLGKPKAEVQATVNEMMDLVQMSQLADRQTSQISGGQQQRVALARAIVPRPSVMLMDEPFSGLDVQLRNTMQEETLRLLKETRATCIIVTHDPEEAMRLADRIAVMHRGRLMQVGKAEELYHEPAGLFVARLFSEINEIAFPVANGQIETPIGAFDIEGVNDGSNAVLCIRERGINLLPIESAGQDSSSPRLPGRILSVKFLGDIAVVEVGLQGFEQPLSVRIAESPSLIKGSDVLVEIDTSRVLIFPEEHVETL
ncbi:MAG: ABC transporter ATP-binding protein, partial [Pseudomonadota bacterium]